MKYVFIWLISIYRKLISPIKPPSCRFSPTCSEYAIQAFRERGFFVGMYLSVWRILRCNPFCKCGYDPVPPRKMKKLEGNTYKSMTEKYEGDTTKENKE